MELLLLTSIYHVVTILQTPTEDNYFMIVTNLSSISESTLEITDLQSSETLDSISQVFSNIAMFVDSSNATINSSVSL